MDCTGLDSQKSETHFTACEQRVSDIRLHAMLVDKVINDTGSYLASTRAMALFMISFTMYNSMQRGYQGSSFPIKEASFHSERISSIPWSQISGTFWNAWLLGYYSKILYMYMYRVYNAVVYLTSPLPP